MNVPEQTAASNFRTSE